MKHLFKQGSDPAAPVLLLLHGTGGTEHDLLPLAEIISPGSSILSVRGNVLENGMPRFFRRLAEGVFDEEDLIFRTNELNQFLDQAAGNYQFPRSKVVAIGYSNGANIAASLLFHDKDALLGAIMHHPMVPLRSIALPDLSENYCFIAAGERDPICTKEESSELYQLLKDAGADVTIHWEASGHQLTHTEVAAAQRWFEKRFKKQ